MSITTQTVKLVPRGWVRPKTRFRGFSYPFRRGPTGFPEPATDEDLIRDSLRQIVRTRRGERVFRPRLGNDVIALVFENNTPSLAARAAREIALAIAEGEPRARVLNIQTERVDESLTVTVEYAVNGVRQDPLRVEDVR